MGEREVLAFLTYLAVERKLAAPTQTQALAALQFLYRHVIDRPLVGLGRVPKARAPVRLPVVLSEGEVQRILGGLDGVPLLISILLYGSGMRLLECLTLRIKDVDLERGEIRIRQGKGAKDRVRVLPQSPWRPLDDHLRRVRALHERDRAEGAGAVELPSALRRKISERTSAVGLAVGVSSPSALCGSRDSGTAPAPSTRNCDAASDGGGGAAERDREARELPHAATLVRDSSSGGGV
jgi:integrase